MFFKIFIQQIYLIIIKVNFFEIIMIFLHFFFKYDKMTTLLLRYKVYVQVLLVFSLKLFFLIIISFMIYNLVLLHGLNIILLKKANGPYEACASAWKVPVCFWWCLSIAKITLSSCHLNWLRAIFLLKQHMSAWRTVCLWHNLFSLSHTLNIIVWSSLLLIF